MELNSYQDQPDDWWKINSCNSQGGVCTLDWPLDPGTGLIKDFGMAQLRRIAAAVKGQGQGKQP